MAQYSLYTVSVTNGSNIVVGSNGTKFLSKVKAGNSFKVKNDPVIYQVASVTDDTHLTISTPYAGTTSTVPVQYQITTDYTHNFGFAEVNVGDQDWPTHLTQETIRKIDEVLGYTISAGVVFKGTWDAALNVPALPTASTGNVGWVYKVSVPHSEYGVGDSVISNGSAWVRIPSPDTASAAYATSAATSASNAATSASNAATSAANAAESEEAAEAFLHAMAAATTVTTQQFGDAGTVGVELPYARQDHKHAMPPLPIDITTKTGLLKGNGTSISAAVAGTDYVAPTGSAAQLTNFPTLNQSTTGNAATSTTLATARLINGVAFNGSANITINAVDSTARIASAEKGVPNGVATLDTNGYVPASQLPSYVDDVLEFPALGDFPATGSAGIVYLSASTNITYRWSGYSYVSIGSDLALGETSSSAYRGDRGKAAYDHSLVAHAPATAEQNVQADWLVSDSGSDAFIQNKPTLGTAAATAATDYVAATSTPRITTSSEAPANPVVNEIWIDDNEAGLGYTVGTAAGTVAAGDDTRIVDAYTHVGLASAHGATGAIVGTTDTQTLTNKTLISPVISSITNTGALTLPTSTDTLVGQATTDTLTNKTINLSSNTLSATIAQLNAACSDSDLVDTTSNQTIGGVKTFSTRTLIGGGTDDGVNKLQVNGGTKVARLNIDYGVSGSGAVIVGSDLHATAKLWRIGHLDAVDKLQFSCDVADPQMSLTSSGNLLIGTTTNDGVNKLQVNGGVCIGSSLGIGTSPAAGASLHINSINPILGRFYRTNSSTGIDISADSAGVVFMPIGTDVYQFYNSSGTSVSFKVSATNCTIKTLAGAGTGYVKVDNNGQLFWSAT